MSISGRWSNDPASGYVVKVKVKYIIYLKTYRLGRGRVAKLKFSNFFLLRICVRSHLCQQQ